MDQETGFWAYHILALCGLISQLSIQLSILSSGPQNQSFKTGVVVHTYHLSFQEVEGGGSRVSYSEFKVNLRHV